MEPRHRAIRTRVRASLATRLSLLLVASMVATFAGLGYLTLRHHREHLERATLASAERVSDLIERSTSYCMLRNDREGLYHIIETIADEPGVVRVRVFNEEGRISLSTDAHEEDTFLDKQAEACYACHASEEPLTSLERPDRFRIYRRESGERILGIINPIENRESCWSAACHAHPPDQKILGVLDTSLSLTDADAAVMQSSSEMVIFMVLGVAFITLLSGVFVWQFVHRPVSALKMGTEKLAKGDLGYQIDLKRLDELGDLAASFNRMSRQLQEAREEITAWTQTLEERVDEKSTELRLAHDHVVHVEKMASLGKLAASVAHEINNPLSGILTYAKLIRRWIEKSGFESEDKETMLSSLHEIETESRRCGEIVKNLLMFSRAAPINLEPNDLNSVVSRCARLVNHKLDLAGINLELNLDPELPLVTCDAAQMEQVVLALVVNAVEAMPRGGNLTLRTLQSDPPGMARLQVKDNGPGIPEEMLDNLFEPFFTTKDKVGGVGLGLAVSRQIVQRHSGTISVHSDPGTGTTFTVDLHFRPPDHSPPGEPQSAAEFSQGVSS